jgi:flagellar biosynthesis/type III secretory pathway protein FliH
MKNLSEVSIPFTFEDLELQGAEGSESQFVTLFPSPEPEAPEEQILEIACEPQDVEPSEDSFRKVFEDAYVQGEKAGYEMGMRRVESIAKRLEKQVAEVVSFKQELTDKYERLSTELALIFAEALVLRTCADQKDILADMIRKALEACEDRGELIIRVRAEDVKYVEGLASQHLKIVSDDTLNEPGFVIETNMGDIDGRIRTQIDELKGALIGYHGE